MLLFEEDFGKINSLFFLNQKDFLYQQMIFLKIINKSPILILESRPSMRKPSITQKVTINEIVTNSLNANVTIMSRNSIKLRLNPTLALVPVKTFGNKIDLKRNCGA